MVTTWVQEKPPASDAAAYLGTNMGPIRKMCKRNLTFVVSSLTVTPWGDYLDQLLGERDLSIRSFAKLVGVSHNFVSRAMRGVVHGKNGTTVSKPPLETIEEWAETLHLDASERKRFRTLAQLEHTPDDIANEYLDLKSRVAWLEKQEAEIRRRLEGR